MEIAVNRVGAVAILECTGTLDADTVARFKKVVYGLYDEGVVQFVIDGKALAFVDSMGLGAMISLLRQVKEKKGDVKIVNLTDDVRSVFEVTRLHRVFDICPTTHEACHRF